MDTVPATSVFKPAPPSQPRSSAQDEQHIRADLPTSTTTFGVQISAEAQYLFEVDKYLSELDRTAQERALDYLSQSGDPLQKLAADHFRKSQEDLDRTLGEDRTLILDRAGSNKLRKLLDAGFEKNGSTEVAVKPMATKVFRLDGNEDFYPVRLGYRNDSLNDQLDRIEKAAHNMLGNQDAANLFGTVRNALSASENILSSFDDVLHFNYSMEKAKAAIDAIEVPDNIASALTNVLNQSVEYQDGKQSRFLDDTRRLMEDDRVGRIASEDVRLGTAAQLYNNQLQSSLNATGLSVLSARGVMMGLLAEHTDLVRFGSDKLDEALSFYQRDFEGFERVLNKEFGLPAPNVNEVEIDTTLLNTGQEYAASVIEKVKNHLSE